MLTFYFRQKLSLFFNHKIHSNLNHTTVTIRSTLPLQYSLDRRAGLAGVCFEVEGRGGETVSVTAGGAAGATGAGATEGSGPGDCSPSSACVHYIYVLVTSTLRAYMLTLRITATCYELCTLFWNFIDNQFS